MAVSPQAAGQPKLWTKDFILGTAINFLIMTNYYALMVVMADYSMKQYGASASTAGLVASIFIIGALVSRFVTGGIMDRVGRKRLLLIAAGLELVFSALYLLGLPIALLFALRFFHGMCYGGGSTTVGTIVTSIVPDARKGEGVGYYMLSVTLGAAIGPFLGMFLSQVAGAQVLFVAAAAIAAVCLVAVVQLKAPAPAAREGRGMNGKADARTSNASAAAAGAQSGASAASPARMQHAFRFTDYFELSIVPIGITCCILFFCYSSLLTFLTPFSAEAGLTQASSFFFVVYAIATFVTRPFTGRLFDRRGDRVVMVPAYLAFVVGMALLSTVHHPVAMLVAAALLGFGVGTVQSSALAMAVQTAPDSRLSLANSTFYMFLDVGVGVGPFVLGLVEPALGYRGLFAAMAFVAIIAMIGYLMVSVRTGRKHA